ncbi:hypothetical protein D3C71_1543610 [compost metagenome]
MVVADDHRCRIEPQSLFDHFARIHRSTVDGAVEHLPVFDQPMARVHEQQREYLMLEAGQLGAQVLLDCRRRSELGTALHLPVDHVARRFQNVVGRRRQIAPVCVAHQQRKIG